MFVGEKRFFCVWMGLWDVGFFLDNKGVHGVCGYNRRPGWSGLGDEL